MKTILSLLATLALLTLSACGGGGDSLTTPTAHAMTAPVTQPQAASSETEEVRK